MANEMGSTSSKLAGDANDSTPFDVKHEPNEAPGSYSIEVEEDDTSRPPEQADPEVEVVEEESAQPKKKLFEFKLPPSGPLRQVPDYFPQTMIPKGLKFAKGVEAVFMRIPARFTAASHKGDRFLIVWGTSEADEKLAIGRSMGDQNRGISEMAKQTIRAIDGHLADWSGMPTPGSVDQLWRELGPKGRNLISRLMMRINTLDEEELTYFFEQCIAVVPTG